MILFYIMVLIVLFFLLIKMKIKVNRVSNIILSKLGLKVDKF